MSNTPRLKNSKGNDVRLSLCMIVKNEAEVLEKCLSTARPHVDEIVIVDTGSTDGTLDIARRYADVLEEIEWPDSFAEARNVSLDLATGDFVIVLDGDEFLPDPLHWRSIRKALAEGDVALIRVPIKNLLPEGQIIAADRMWQERIYANHPEIRYEGRIHNQIYKGLQAYIHRTGHRIVDLPAEVIHTGYAHATDRMKEKYQVRVHLLEHEVSQALDPKKKAYYSYQLGVVQYVLEEFDTALDTLGGVEYEYLEPGNAFYTHLLAAQAAIQCKLPTRSLIHCNAMLELDRSEPVAYHITGMALLMAHQFSDGLLMLLEALSINGASGTNRFVLNNSEMMVTLARLCRSANLEKHARAFDLLREQEEFRPAEAAGLIQSLKFGLVQAPRAVA